MIYVNYKQKYEKSYRKIWTFEEKSVPLHSQLSNTPIATLKQGAIAQLVEQRTENPCVPGSIPGGTTKDQACKDSFTGFFVSISSFFIFSFHIHNHETIAYQRQAFSTKEKQNKKERAKLSYRNNLAFTLQKHSYYLLKA